MQAIKDEEKAVAEIVHHLETDGDDVCCILLEPIQGEGGDNHFRPEFWQQLRQIANKYDVLLIADEVRSNISTTCVFPIYVEIYILYIWCAYIYCPALYIYICAHRRPLPWTSVMTSKCPSIECYENTHSIPNCLIHIRWYISVI